MEPLRRPDPVQLLGESEAIQALDAEISRAAKSDAKVLITGETGVGKEVACHLIHHRSRRAAAPLITVNCAGVPDTLLESELFGYTRGSFTGAYRDKAGLLEMAVHGTVFMDEVGEMSMRMQAVLLRFLETSEIQRVGSERPHTRVDVRVISATNRTLPDHIASGAFREDLYFRLNVIRLHIPPLRERAEDIPLLVNRYLAVFSDQHRMPRPIISPAVMAKLASYPWPGNIREVKNVVERLVLRADNGIIGVADLSRDLVSVTARAAVPSAGAVRTSSVGDALALRIIEGGESFWSAVYPAFIGRQLTCNDLRAVIAYGLERTNGNYRSLVRLFNMPPEDYKRFLRFLRKHHCNLPFQPFREGLQRLNEQRHPATVSVPARKTREESCA